MEDMEEDMVEVMEDLVAVKEVMVGMEEVMDTKMLNDLLFDTLK